MDARDTNPTFWSECIFLPALVNSNRFGFSLCNNNSNKQCSMLSAPRVGESAPKPLVLPVGLRGRRNPVSQDDGRPQDGTGSGTRQPPKKGLSKMSVRDYLAQGGNYTFNFGCFELAFCHPGPVRRIRFETRPRTSKREICSTPQSSWTRSRAGFL